MCPCCVLYLLCLWLDCRWRQTGNALPICREKGSVPLLGIHLVVLKKGTDPCWAPPCCSEEGSPSRISIHPLPTNVTINLNLISQMQTKTRNERFKTDTIPPQTQPSNDKDDQLAKEKSKYWLNPEVYNADMDCSSSFPIKGELKISTLYNYQGDYSEEIEPKFKSYAQLYKDLTSHHRSGIQIYHGGSRDKSDVCCSFPNYSRLIQQDGRFRMPEKILIASRG